MRLAGAGTGIDMLDKSMKARHVANCPCDKAKQPSGSEVDVGATWQRGFYSAQLHGNVSYLVN